MSDYILKLSKELDFKHLEPVDSLWPDGEEGDPVRSVILPFEASESPFCKGDLDKIEKHLLEDGHTRIYSIYYYKDWSDYYKYVYIARSIGPKNE